MWERASGPESNGAAMKCEIEGKDPSKRTAFGRVDVNDNRRIVFDQRMTVGTHTLTIVNLATAGHPRIDVDAFLL